jgi:hypothetical protein
MKDRLRTLLTELMLIPGLSGYEGRVRRPDSALGGSIPTRANLLHGSDYAAAPDLGRQLFATVHCTGLSCRVAQS